VRSAEVDRDTVVLGLAVAQQAEGARPAPPQQLYQVFTISGAQIIDIRGYPDRRGALARTTGGVRFPGTPTASLGAGQEG
jgi:predicted secreted Zn-dependent protease